MPIRWRSAPRRGRLRALMPLLLSALIAGCALPWSTSSAPTTTPRETIVAGTPVAIGVGAWQRVALPGPSGAVNGYAVAPTNPDIIYACTGPDQPDTMTLWRTSDAGAHWTRYAPLSGTGTECQLTIAPDDAQRVLVQISSGVAKGQFCATDSDYLSDDGGATWKRLSPYTLSIPASAPYDFCEVAISRDHLFLTFASSDSTNPDSLLARSDDDGQTWRRIDGTLGDSALFFTPQVGPKDHMAMNVLHFSAPPGGETVTLWTSADAGATWTRGSDVTGAFGAFLLSSLPAAGVSWPSASYPFYALVSEQLPSILYRESTLTSGDGRHWSALPKLPVPGVGDEQSGILQVLAALPNGRLAVWGADPQTGLSTISDPQTQFWLWLWDPVAGAWQIVAAPLAVTASEGCGLCWQAATSTAADGSIYLYVSYYLSGIAGDTPVGLVRLRIPAA